MPETSAPGSPPRRVVVNVIIPCYNQARYLVDAIRSVRAQEYAGVEAIVVDDGSTDDTAAVATREGARLIRQKQGGLGAARNTGLAAARGDFVLFLDADDELLPHAVGSGVALLQKNPALGCVVRRCEVMDSAGRPLPTHYPALNANDLYGEWLSHNFVWTPGAAVFRTARLAALGGFPVDIGPASDYAVYLSLARAGAVAFEPVNVVRYRQHDSNMSRDPVLMLTATLSALSRERHHVPTDRVADFRRGVRRWREVYGEQVVERMRREWRTRTASRWQLGAVWTLVRHCPRVLVRHLTRKLSRVARGLPPAPVEKGRFGPELSTRPRSAPLQD